MKYLCLVCTAIMLTGCAATPVKQKFPEAPAPLLESCPQLQKATPSTSQLQELLSTVVSNYSLHYQCAAKVQGWQEWYQAQRQVYSDVK